MNNLTSKVFVAWIATSKLCDMTGRQSTISLLRAIEELLSFLKTK